MSQYMSHLGHFGEHKIFKGHAPSRLKNLLFSNSRFPEKIVYSLTNIIFLVELKPCLCYYIVVYILVYSFLQFPPLKHIIIFDFLWPFLITYLLKNIFIVIY